MTDLAGRLRTRAELLASWRGRLVVSCQARSGPLRHADSVARIASDVLAHGAVAVRVDTPEHVAAVRAVTDAGVIGLSKDESRRSPDRVFITPTIERAIALVEAGADVVAADGADADVRQRPGPFADLVEAVHAHGALVMADVSTAAEAVAAVESGADCVGTTLAGYTTASATRAVDGGSDGPALEVIAACADAVSVPVLAEGRLHTDVHVRAAFENGAHAVVIGHAITDPGWLTERFAAVTPAGIGAAER